MFKSLWTTYLVVQLIFISVVISSPTLDTQIRSRAISLENSHNWEAQTGPSSANTLSEPFALNGRPDRYDRSNLDAHHDPDIQARSMPPLAPSLSLFGVSVGSINPIPRVSPFPNGPLIGSAAQVHILRRSLRDKNSSDGGQVEARNINIESSPDLGSSQHDFETFDDQRNISRSRQELAKLNYSSIGEDDKPHEPAHLKIAEGTNQTARSSTAVTRLKKRHLAYNNQDPDCELTGSRKPALLGIRCDNAEVTSDGVTIVRAYEPTRIYVIGRNLYSNLTIAITEQEGSPQDDCTHADRIKSLRLYNYTYNVAEVYIDLPPPNKKVPYYFCVREDYSDARWYHQGSEAWLKIYVESDLLPLWMMIIVIACLLCLSGLFSGLNLGLMALDKNELQVIMKCGSPDEKRYAAAIEPARKRGNYLLCSILFSNTLVNSTVSIFIDSLTGGLVAVMASTILVVMFGEILPQAFCSRHGLAVGAKTIWLTNLCMFITFPLSYPVSYCLDWALGEEIGHAYDRERLMEFIQVTRDINNLEADEVNIISGALKIKRVQISEIMTRIEDVYMLDENSVLDFDTIQTIVGKGYSRIPVHETGNRRNIKAVLFAKDLALVDPDDNTPVQTMINFYNHPRMFVYEDTTLDAALNEFKTGKSHMAIVQRVIDDGERDPYYEVTGIVTLEDVIEEIMQMEINDETDTLSDNRKKRRRKDAQVRKDFSQFMHLGSGDSSFNVVTPQLCLAAYQYLATTVEPFTPQFLSDTILRKLLSQKIFYKVKADEDISARRLYTAGEPADYFIIILEGRVHVICGKESLMFDAGPFSFFGKAALTATQPLSGFETTTNQATTPLQSVATSSRRESTRPVLSRRESLAKIVSSPLGSLSAIKRSAEQTGNSANPDDTLNASPVAIKKDGCNSGSTELIELANKEVHYFKPDYTVDIITNTSYLKVTRNDYITALNLSSLERKEANVPINESEILPIISNELPV